MLNYNVVVLEIPCYLGQWQHICYTHCKTICYINRCTDRYTTVIPIVTTVIQLLCKLLYNCYTNCYTKCYTNCHTTVILSNKLNHLHYMHFSSVQSNCTSSPQLISPQYFWFFAFQTFWNYCCRMQQRQQRQQRRDRRGQSVSSVRPSVRSVLCNYPHAVIVHFGILEH